MSKNRLRKTLLWGDTIQENVVVSSTTDINTPWKENIETINNQSNIENKEMGYAEIKKLTKTIIF